MDSAASPPSLVRKLAEVMLDVERIAKNGRNDHFRYDFVTESDVSAAIRGGLAERNVMIMPSVKSTAFREAPGGKQTIATLHVDYTFHDGDTGEVISVTMVGEGADAGDKCVYKALAGCTKYLLLKTFLVPTGDDPEVESAPRPEAQQAPAQPRPPTQLRAALEVQSPKGDGLSHLRTPETKILYGTSKGKHYCDIGEKDLRWYLASCEKNLVEKPEYEARTKKTIAIIQAELERRRKAS